MNLKPGVRYIVTRASKNKEFQIGDHIWVAKDGCLINKEAMGWLEPDDIPEATNGLEVKVDEMWYAKELQKRKAALDELSRDARDMGIDRSHYNL